MATEIKSNVVRVKPQDGSSSSKSKLDSSLSSIKKKVGVIGNNNSTKQQVAAVDSKHKSVTTTVSSKTEVKGKLSTSSSKTTTKKTVVKTREKKVFSLPGQKFDPPEEREPLRIFYESLSKQIPSSEMAEFWMMEHGLLSPDKAKKAHEKKQRKQKQIRMGTPIKSPPPPPPPSRGESSKRPLQVSKNGSDVKAKKRIMDGSDDEDDFVLSHKRRKG